MAICRSIKQALLDHPDRNIGRRARQLLAKGADCPIQIARSARELITITKVRGDAAAGKLIFQNQCSKCHVHSGVGTRIGPELTGMAVHTKEHLLTDILDPSRSVEGNFRAYSVVMKSGRILTGLLASESKTAIELFDAEGKKQTLLRDEIDELVATPKSLMPDGFEKQVSRKDLDRPARVLTQHGRFPTLPYESAYRGQHRGHVQRREVMSEWLVAKRLQPKTFAEVPSHFVDPDAATPRHPLYGPQGSPQRMPCRQPAQTPGQAIILSGVSGWGHPYGEKGRVDDRALAL